MLLSTVLQSFLLPSSYPSYYSLTRFNNTLFIFSKEKFCRKFDLFLSLLSPTVLYIELQQLNPRSCTLYTISVWQLCLLWYKDLEQGQLLNIL
jgi:hypothetical protein